MGNTKVWLFRLLIIACGGLLVLSWFLPWWAIDVYEIGKNAVVIRPWGLETNLRPADYELIKSGEMPAFFAPAMWTYLGLCILGLLVAVFINNKTFRLKNKDFNLSGFLIGLIGFSYIVVVITAVIVAAIRTGDFWEVKLIGYSFISLGDPYVSGAEAGLKIGYWLACAAGPLLMILALIRSKIIGNNHK
ncbi:MAG: hypothetical protein PHQ86_03645 [Dehalococcoidales bacterium]|nr:hypothetical protein [Dehalococcoidales bacterium]